MKTVQDGLSRFVLSLAALGARLIPMSVTRALYRWRGLARLLRGGLNRAAPHGITEVAVAAGSLAGIRLLLDLQTEKDYWLGTYEPQFHVAIADFTQPGDVAYDVGANIGYITLLLSRCVGETGRVYAFEALPANLARLRANLELNGTPTNIEVVSKAVVESSGEVRFLVGPSGGMGKAEGSKGRQNVAYTGVINVPGISLDVFVYEQGYPAPNLVKIDIEGGEVLALPGMQRIIKERKPVVLLELHGPEAAHTVWEELAAAGYRFCRMVSGYPEIASVEVLDWKAYIVALPLP